MGFVVLMVLHLNWLKNLNNFRPVKSTFPREPAVDDGQIIALDRCCPSQVHNCIHEASAAMFKQFVCQHVSAQQVFMYRKPRNEKTQAEFVVVAFSSFGETNR